MLWNGGEIGVRLICQYYEMLYEERTTIRVLSVCFGVVLLH